MRKFLVAGLLILGLAGCSEWNDDRGRGDAPVANDKDDSPAQVINFPDRFANVAFKCYNGTGIYTTTRNAPPVIIDDDTNCNGDEELLAPQDPE